MKANFASHKPLHHGAAPVVFLQFRLVVVVVRVVEMFGLGRAFLDTGAAFNADARHFRHVFRIDGTHRADFHAQVAFHASL